MVKRMMAKRLLAFALVVLMLFGLLPSFGGQSMVMDVDASSKATTSSSGGTSSGSSSGSYYDSRSGATGSSSSGSGNAAVSSSNYNMSKYSAVSGITGPQLAAVIDNTPLFYKSGSTYTQLMYYCMSGYAYMFYLSGSSYSNYVAIGYGYSSAIEWSDSSVKANLYVGTLKTGSGSSTSGTVYTGTASVNDAEGSFLTLNVSVKNGKVIALTADDENCVGTWGTLLASRESEYVNVSVSDASNFDGVSAATMYSAAVKEAVLNALSLTASGSGGSSGGTTDSGETVSPSGSVTLSVGQTATLDGTHNSMASSESWTSNNPSVATVTGKDYPYAYQATVTAVKAGTATITHTINTLFGNSTETFTVTVTGSGSDSGSSSGSGTSAASLTLDKSALNLQTNGGVAFVYASSDLASGKSSNSSVATVSVADSAALVTAKSAGTATITLTGVNGAAATLTVTVKDYASPTAEEYIQMLSDSYSSHTKGSGEDLYLHADADFDSFLALLWNGSAIPADQYSLKRGSIIANIDSDFVDAQSEGENTVSMVTTQGIVEQKVTLLAASGSSDAGKTITPGGSATIYVGETLTLQGTKPSSYGNYHYWYTDEEDVDYIDWDIDNDASSTYYAGTNIANITGVAAGTVTVYHQYISGRNWVNPGETFTITVLSNSSEPSPEPSTEPSPAATDTPTTPPEHVKSISGSGDSYTISLNVTGKDVTTTTTTTTPGQTVTKGTNLVIVIDVSGSIVGKESALNNAIQSLVNGLPSNSQVGVVTFNETASAGRVYTANTISGLSFSGVDGKGTNMATGISAATSLLNGSGWTNKSNDKAMVIISDFDVDDYTDSINNAKTAKSAGTTIYSVKIDSTTVGAASRTELSTDYRADSITAVTRYISSQYPSASAVNNSMFGMFNQATVTAGTADNSATYVYGAGGGNWGDIFTEIKETQGITETTATTVHTQGVVIADTLSDYVTLANTDSESKYGVTVDDMSNYTVSVSGKTVTVTLGDALNDGVTYTVNIPVTVTAKAHTEANAASTATSTFPSNASASLTYQFGDGDAATESYAQSPTFTVAKENTGASVTVNKTTAPVSGSADEFDVTLAVNTTEKVTSTTLQQVIGEYLTTAEFWYKQGADYPDSTIQTGKIYNGVPEQDLIDLRQSTGNKAVTYNLYNASGTLIGSYTMNTNANNYHAYIKLDASHYLPVGKEIFKGSTVTINLDNDSLDYLLQKVYETTTVTSESAIALGTVTDKMSDYVTYVKDIAVKGGSTSFNNGTKTLTWTIAANPDAEVTTSTSTSGNTTTTTIVTTNAAVLTYRVKANTGADGFKFGKDLPANAEAKLSYTIDGESGTATFPVPTIQVAGAEIALSYDANGGSGAPEAAKQTVTSGASASFTVSSTEPTRESYNFLGWAESADATEAQYHAGDKITISADKTLYAVWELATADYTVEHYQQDVTGDGYTLVTADTETKSGTIGQQTTAEAKTYEGFTANDFDQETIAASDTVVKIYYDRETFTVQYVDEDGTALQTETVRYGAEVPAYTGETPTKAATAQNSYTFTGWTPAAPETVTANLTFTAKYSEAVNQYTVKFVDEDGSELSSAQYDYGTAAADIDQPADPTKDATAQYAYTFAGWTPEIAPVTGDATYTATYTETLRSYTITWKNDDGTVIDTTTVNYGETLTHADPTKAATAEYTYTFDKWSPEVTAVTGDATYTASFTAAPKSYTVTYKVDGEVYGEVETIPFGTALTAREAPAKTGYTFSGWSEVPTTMPAKDVVIEGTFTVNRYTVRFLNDDGSVISAKEYDYGTAAADVTVPAAPEKTNPVAGQSYTFSGWDKEIADVTANADYTAVFTNSDITFTITWKDDAGKVIDTDTVTYGTTPSHADLSKSDPTNEYTYTWTGWDKEIVPATDDATYQGTFRTEKTGYKIIIEDYTKGKAAVSLTDADFYYLGGTTKLSDRFYTTGQTYTFTVSAPMATVLAIHEDGSAEKILDEDGTYTRMYCTALEDGSYQFSVDVDGADVYLVMAYKGDLTLDGRVNTIDAAQTAMIAARNRTASKLASLVADVIAPFNRVNTLDASQLAQVAARNKTLAWDVQ